MSCRPWPVVATLVLMPKFNAHAYLTLAQQHHATHTMLVPVQYQRILAEPDFGQFDLSAFKLKFCTSAPFSAELKAEVLARWPGGLIEYYGMTEGGGTCALLAHQHPGQAPYGRPAHAGSRHPRDRSGRDAIAAGRDR